MRVDTLRALLYSPKLYRSVQLILLGGHMKMHRSVCFVAAAALAGSALAAVVVPATNAGAVVPKTANCTASNGNADSSNNATEYMLGCTQTSTLSHATPYAVTTSAGATSTGKVYWTNGKDTTFKLAYSIVGTNACPTYLGVASVAEVAETITVKGGTSGLTTGKDATPSDTCVYSVGANLAMHSLGGFQ